MDLQLCDAAAFLDTESILPDTRSILGRMDRTDDADVAIQGNCNALGVFQHHLKVLSLPDPVFDGRHICGYVSMPIR